MALSSTTFSDAGGAVTDLFAGFGAQTQADLKAQSLDLQAQGDLAEASNYDLASSLATKNEAYTATSTAIQQAQQERNTYLQIGGQKAAIAGAGFAESGSALDILADSARQGALAKATLGTQGLITEAGYQEQAQSYNTLATTARTTAAGLENIANETKSAGTMSEIGDFVGGALKAAGAVASVALAPATGGLSLAGIGGLFMGGGSPSGL